MMEEPPHSPHSYGIRIATFTENSLPPDCSPASSPLGLEIPVRGKGSSSYI